MGTAFVSQQTALEVPVGPEIEQAVQDALLRAASILEKARCLEAEHEASILMASSLLGHPPGNSEPTVDVSNLPGGVRDAWEVLADASRALDAPVSDAAALSPVLEMAKKDETDLKIGHGQLGRAVYNAGLSGCLERAAEIDAELSQRKTQDGSILASALSTAKGSLTSQNHHTKLWLRIFDERLRQIKTFHARHDAVDRAVASSSHKRQRVGNPSADGYDLASIMVQHVTPLKEGTLFNSEEVLGKYLDLQPLYESTVASMKPIFAPDNGSANSSPFGLREFLLLLSKGLDNVPEANKLKDRKKYVRFLSDLQVYLEAFLRRRSPLLNLEDVVAPAIKDFELEWRKTGGSSGWTAKASEASMVDLPSTNDPQSIKKGIDLTQYASAEDVAKAVDGDALKAELSRLGLKCGGTVLDRAKRLFLTKDTPLDQLPKKLFAKKSKDDNDASKGAANATLSSGKSDRRVDVARKEAVVMALLNQLRPTLDATLKRAERRETQTLKEREKEMAEDLHGSALDEGTAKKEKNDGGDYDSDDDDDEDTPIYNPKGVPLGWDGKPIPYWLFKLHGLNHFYPCEICGNESYRGRRNFETHFAEAKHAFGMKSLGIPNTKHFHGVTKIEDAQKLWDKLKETLGQEQFDGSKDEEYEDSHGNVLSRATYEDLARQGLL